MQDLVKRLEELQEEFLKVYEKLKITEKLKKISELEKEVAEPEIWHDVKRATEKNQELAKLSSEVQPWELLNTQISDLKELLGIADDGLKEEIRGQVDAMERDFVEMKKALWFQGEYDGDDAIIRITAGAGGTEAMDWAGMLERMYLRFFERKGFNHKRNEPKIIFFK